MTPFFIADLPKYFIQEYVCLGPERSNTNDRGRTAPR